MYVPYDCLLQSVGGYNLCYVKKYFQNPGLLKEIWHMGPVPSKSLPRRGFPVFVPEQTLEFLIIWGGYRDMRCFHFIEGIQRRLNHPL